jgi:hypothetical protein
MKIRHSSLPKLALCGQYEGAPGTSPAAERGTKLDAAFRHAWTHGEFPDWDLPEEDAQAVRWAIDQCIRLNGGADNLTTIEDRCRIHTKGARLPDGREANVYLNQLRAIEAEAHAAGRGAWEKARARATR